MKKCSNCKHRWCTGSWGLTELCFGFEMTENEEDEIREAETCGKYEEGSPDDEREYCHSATAGDYGPGNPWDAPGMSVRDFI